MARLHAPREGAPARRPLSVLLVVVGGGHRKGAKEGGALAGVEGDCDRLRVLSALGVHLELHALVRA